MYVQLLFCYIRVFFKTIETFKYYHLDVVELKRNWPQPRYVPLINQEQSISFCGRITMSYNGPGVFNSKHFSLILQLDKCKYVCFHCLPAH